MKRSESDPIANELSKGFDIKISELINALRILRDAIGMVRSGLDYHLPVLSGQMRGLLIDKSRNSEKRLLHTADQLGIPLAVYCMDGVDNPHYPFTEKPEFWVSGFPITVRKQFKNQKKMLLEDVIGKPFILYKDVKYTPRSIIEWFANRAGGSHYSSKIPSHFSEMLTMQIGQLAPLKNLLLQLAESTFEIGSELINSITEIEFHALVKIPEKTGKTAFLLDSVYPNSPMRFTIIADSNDRIIVRLTGIDGSKIESISDRVVEWSEVDHINIRIGINRNLNTFIDVFINGESISQTRTELPVFVFNKFVEYNTYFNRNADEEFQDFSFGLGEFCLYEKNSSKLDQARALIYQNEKRTDPELIVVMFGNKSYGYVESGSNNMKFVGNNFRASRQSSWKNIDA